jgi:hypothetical protein
LEQGRKSENKMVPGEILRFLKEEAPLLFNKNIV